MAILVRVSFQIREFEKRCLEMNIPYRIIGGLRFYERAEIRDANAYLRLMVHNEDDLAFTRIINQPKRGLGQATLLALSSLAKQKNISLLKACALGQNAHNEAGVQSRQSAVLTAFARQIFSWQEQMNKMPAHQLAFMILEQSGLMGRWRLQKQEDAQSKLDNLKELTRAIGEFPTLTSYLEHVALMTDHEADLYSENKKRVNIMTLHAAKGLEFDIVFLPGWEEEIFPHHRSFDLKGGLEEERRLAYVGLTRAKKQIFISYVESRLMFNEWRQAYPSRFIEEMGEERIIRKQIWEACSLSENQKRQASGQDPEQVYGTRIIHDIFGEGTIIEADGDHLTILFDDAGHKMIKAGFVKKIGL